MNKVRMWFQKHKILLDAHIEEKRTTCAPSPVWWIYIMAVAEYSCLATATFKSTSSGPSLYSLDAAAESCVHADISIAFGGRTRSSIGVGGSGVG